MKSRKTIYCEYQFIKSLPQDQLDDFYRFTNESVIVFDMTFDQFVKESCENSIFKYIMKRQQAGSCNLKFDYDANSFNNDCKKANINSFNPIVLIYQTGKQRKIENRCGQITRQYGLLAADQHDFLEKCNLDKDYGFAIKKRTESSWKSLLDKVPFYGNSLIIVDNYLLSDSNTFDLNLKSILNFLLPETLETEFNISFFTQDTNSTLKSKIYGIEELIKKLRPELIFTVNYFIDTRKLFHDRVIISNYFWMQCGAGFDLFGFNSKAKHSTTVSIIYPFMQSHVPWAVDAFSYLLQDTKETAKSAVNNGPVEQFYGKTKDNRLFKMQ